LLEEAKRDELLESIKTLAKDTQKATLENTQSQERVNRLEIERGLMASLDQVMESLERMKERLKEETEAEEIDELKDTMEFYKTKRKDIKAELRRLV
jgi:nucleoside phosphorylase